MAATAHAASSAGLNTLLGPSALRDCRSWSADVLRPWCARTSPGLRRGEDAPLGRWNAVAAGIRTRVDAIERESPFHARSGDRYLVTRRTTS